MNYIVHKLVLGHQRSLAKDQGMYDGRFMQKSIPDKKKNLHLKLRKNKNIDL
jgi:hypothetical protein